MGSYDVFKKLGIKSLKAGNTTVDLEKNEIKVPKQKVSRLALCKKDIENLLTVLDSTDAIDSKEQRVLRKKLIKMGKEL